ncbi:MAG: DUF2007 domain-containing protein [Gammaproteobacteria bacterium]|nr:DUF2007 domain-containing protein [Gammaproteobacteria bacterium]
MKKLTASESLITINHFKNVLQSEGIACRIKNSILGGIAGEMPLDQVWPELWVINDLDYDRAKQLIDKAITDESPQEPWKCRKCGEENEGQFAACWKCGEKSD